MRYEIIESVQSYCFNIAEPTDGYKSDSSSNGVCLDDINSRSGIDKKPTYNPGSDIDGAWKFSLEILFFEFLKMFVPAVHDLIDTSVKPESKETELNELDFSLVNKKLISNQKLLSKESIKNKKPNKRIVDKLVKVKLKNGEDAFLLVHIEVQSRVNSYAQQLRFSARMHEYHKMLTSKFIGYKFINIGVLLNSSGPAVHSRPSSITKRCFYTTSNESNKHISNDINSDMHDTANLDNAIHKNVDFLIYKKHYAFYQESTFKFPVIHLAKWIDREDDLMDLAHSNPFAIIVLYQILAFKHPNLQERKKAKLQTIKILQLEQRFAYSKDLLDDLTRIMDRLIYLPENLNNEFYKEVRKMGTTTEPRLISIFDVMARKEGLEEGLEKGLVEGQANMLIELLNYKFDTVTNSIIDRIKSANLEQIRTWSLNLLNAQTIDEVFND